MLRARLIRALPVWLQTHACLLLLAHSYEIDPVVDDQWRLRCTVCPYVSEGIPVAPRRSRRGPAPVERDWYADEHFQGDHANVR